MAGTTDLDALLRDLMPSLSEGAYVFCTLEDARYGDLAHTRPLATVQEREGLTLVIPKAEADRANLPYEGTFRHITLEVHSSLEAVGLTAAVSRDLARHGISANVIAGYHHDHILVPAEHAERALGVLTDMSPPRSGGDG